MENVRCPGNRYLLTPASRGCGTRATYSVATVDKMQASSYLPKRIPVLNTAQGSSNVAVYGRPTRNCITSAGTVLDNLVLPRRAYAGAGVQNVVSLVLYMQGLVPLATFVRASGMVIRA